MEQPVIPENEESTAPRVTELPLVAWERALAGFLVILAMCLAFLVIVAYWPDKLPAGQNGTYIKKAFHVQLIPNPTSTANPPIADHTTQTPTNPPVPKTPAEIEAAKVKAKKDSADRAAAKAKEAAKPAPCPSEKCEHTIELNSLLLILVAAAGFLGNMVHIANSLTAFIGAGTYRRSWAPWYFVKPFTAAGLAMFVYFMLGSSDNSAVNLKTVLGTAALAGLFTDIATQKLREVLVALVKPTDTRPDKLMPAPALGTTKAMTIDSAGIKPAALDQAKATPIIIGGTNLVKDKLVITMHGQTVTDAVITPTRITFNFTVTDQGKTAVELLITDTDAKKLGGKIWPATS